MSQSTKRGGLLAAIRKGKVLKKTQPSSQKQKQIPPAIPPPPIPPPLPMNSSTDKAYSSSGDTGGGKGGGGGAISSLLLEKMAQHLQISDQHEILVSIRNAPLTDTGPCKTGALNDMVVRDSCIISHMVAKESEFEWSHSFWYCGKCNVLNKREQCSICKKDVNLAMQGTTDTKEIFKQTSISERCAKASATSTASQNTVVQSSFSDAKIHQALGKEMKESEQYKLSEAEQSNQIPNGLDCLEKQTNNPPLSPFPGECKHTTKFVWNLTVRSKFQGSETWQECIDVDKNKTFYYHPPTETSTWTLPPPLAQLYNKYRSLAGSSQVLARNVIKQMKNDGLTVEETLTGIKVLARFFLTRSRNKKAHEFSYETRASLFHLWRELELEKRIKQVNEKVTRMKNSWFRSKRSRRKKASTIFHTVASAAAALAKAKAKSSSSSLSPLLPSSPSSPPPSSAPPSSSAASSTASSSAASSAAASSAAASESSSHPPYHVQALVTPRSTKPSTKVMKSFTCPWCTYKNSGESPACALCHRTQAAFDDKLRRQAEDDKLSKPVCGDAWDCPKCTWKNEIGSGVCSMCGGEEVWSGSFIPGHEVETAEKTATAEAENAGANAAARANTTKVIKMPPTSAKNVTVLPSSTAITLLPTHERKCDVTVEKVAEKSAALSPPKLFKQSSAERAFTSPLLWDLEHAEQAYTKVLAKCQFAPDAKMHSGGKSIHAFSKTLTMAKGKTVNKKRMKRIAKELKVLRFNLPLSTNASVFLRYDASRPYLMRALLTGPTDTPYEGGLYCYDIYCGDEYPQKPPSVKITTTGGGKVRFNPNLYSNGKVCLSLLGTWRGKSANEGWTKKSTLLQVLISIQSTIMGVKYPYFNEPGRPGYFENGNKEPTGALAKKARTDPNGGWEKLRVENIKQAMVEQLRHPAQGFEESIRAHFYLRQKAILKTVDGWLASAIKDRETTKGHVEAITQAILDLKKEIAKLNKDPPRCCIDAYKELEEESGYEEAKENATEKTKKSSGILDTLASIFGHSSTSSDDIDDLEKGKVEPESLSLPLSEKKLAAMRDEERQKRKEVAKKKAEAKQAAIAKMVEELEEDMKS